MRTLAHAALAHERDAADCKLAASKTLVNTKRFAVLAAGRTDPEKFGARTRRARGRVKDPFAQGHSQATSV